MESPLISFLACLNIGYGLPLLYANGIAWHFGWVALGIFISMTCHFAGVYGMRQLGGRLTHREPTRTLVLSVGGWIAPVVACLLVLLMVKMVGMHHGVPFNTSLAPTAP